MVTALTGAAAYASATRYLGLKPSHRNPDTHIMRLPSLLVLVALAASLAVGAAPASAALSSPETLYLDAYDPAQTVQITRKLVVRAHVIDAVLLVGATRHVGEIDKRVVLGRVGAGGGRAACARHRFLVRFPRAARGLNAVGKVGGVDRAGGDQKERRGMARVRTWLSGLPGRRSEDGQPHGGTAQSGHRKHPHTQPHPHLGPDRIIGRGIPRVFALVIE